MDKKLARGYAREFITRFPAISEPDFVEDPNFMNQIPSRISAQKARRLSGLLAAALPVVYQISDRRSVYVSMMHHPYSDRDEPELQLCFYNVLFSFNGVTTESGAADCQIGLHAIARFCERLERKPTLDNLKFDQLMRWAAFYQLVYGFDELPEGGPALIPTKDGIWLGLFFNSGETDFSPATMVKQVRKSKVSAVKKNRNSGYKIKYGCNIRTFVDYDLLRQDQIKLLEALQNFSEENQDMFDFAVQLAVHRQKIKYKAENIFPAVQKFWRIIETHEAAFLASLFSIKKTDDNYDMPASVEDYSKRKLKKFSAYLQKRKRARS